MSKSPGFVEGSTAAAEPPPSDGSGLGWLEDSVEAVRRHLLSLQREDGHWCAELEGDSMLESEYFLLLHLLGRSGGERGSKLAAYLRQQQTPDGGWTIYPGGPSEVSASVKAYFVLKLSGDDPQAPHMVRAREAIRAAGGLDACNSFTKLYLSMFGEYEWRRAPAVPPELILLPSWLYLNIYEMSSWSRAIVVPLSIIWALKPSRPVPADRGLGELRTARRARPRLASRRRRFFAALFRAVDRGIKLAEVLRVMRLFRRRALDECEGWVLERLEKSDGLAAIFPSIMNSILGLHMLGYELDHPVIAAQLGELEKLEIDDGERIRLQPCMSPVWDTALAMNALLESGMRPSDPALQRGATWVLAKEVRAPGDWRVKNPEGPVGGWYFEYANEFYPDCDDTSEILALLAAVQMTDPEAEKVRRSAVARGLAWLLSMQNRDGGWAAFDRGCTKEILTLVPFADHNAMIDPSTADVSARAVVALRAHGYNYDHPAVRRGVAFLHREQEADGSWYGRWGANYLYGTWLALCALRAAGERAVGRAPSPAARRGVDWLLAAQNQDGGWGESLRSYDDPASKGQGVSTASQTAWAMLGLVAATGGRDRGALQAILEGAGFLRRTQRRDGSWQDEQWTGTGFPGVFYLRYHLYASYFPLQALSTLRRALEARSGVGRAA